MQDQARAVRDVFERALKQPTRERQDTFVEQYCQSDHALKQAVLELLQADRECERRGFLEWTARGNQRPEDRGVNIGRLIGEYRLLELIGSGASSLVYRGERAHGIRQHVAVKLLRVAYLDASSLKRFEIEKQALADLSHPGIARLINYGTADDGTPYLVMDWIDGERIDQRLQRSDPSIRVRVEWFLQIARIVLAAHDVGILHRDLKPANILITHDHRLLITDFGLAKFVDNARPELANLTVTGGLLGTPGYMAPEQLFTKSGTITASADIYGLGGVLFFLLTQRPPLRGSSPGEIMAAHESSGFSSPREFESQIDRDLETICLKCLQSEPEERYRSVADLVDDVQRYLAGVPIQARPISTAERVYRWARSNRLLASLAVAVITLLLVAFVTVTGFLVVTSQQASQRRELLAILNSELTATAQWLADYPQTHALRMELLQRAKKHAERIASFEPKDEVGRVAHAAAVYRSAKLAGQLGDRETAGSASRHARDLFKQLANDYPEEHDFRFDVFHSEFLLEDYDAAFQTITDLVAEEDDRYYRDALAACAIELGRSARSPEEAERYFEQAHDVAAQLAGEFPAEPFFRRHYDQLTFRWRRNQFTHSEIVAQAHEALAAIDQSLADEPDYLRWHVMYWEVARPAMVSALALGAHDEARDFGRRILKVSEQTRRYAPHSPKTWVSLGATRAELAFHQLYETDEARRAAGRDAISELEVAMFLWPENDQLRCLQMLFQTEVFQTESPDLAAARELLSKLPATWTHFLAPILIRGGDLDAGQSALTTATPRHWQVYAALIHAKRGDFTQADRVLEENSEYAKLTHYRLIAEEVRTLKSDN